MPTDDYLWRAHYRDGSTLDEDDDAGRSRGFRAIDLTRCVALELRPQRADRAPLVLAIPADARPIFFRRRAQDVTTDGTIPSPQRTTTVLGFQKTIHGCNHKTLLAVHPDGSLLLTDDDTLF